MLLYTIRILPHVVQQSKSTENAGEKKKNRCTFRRSPLLAPDSSAVRERLPGSSVLHGWRRENKGREMRMRLTQTLMRVVVLLSASDNVRTESAIEEDGLKAEVAAGSEGQECGSEPHTLMTLQQTVCAGMKHHFSAAKAAMGITKKTATAVDSDPSHVII